MACHVIRKAMRFHVGLIMILRIWIQYCIFLVLVELLLIQTTLCHKSRNSFEFLFSFLLGLHGNHQTAKIEVGNSAKFPFSFSLDLVSEF